MGLDLYVFGNKYLEEDSFAIKVAKKLNKKDVNVVECPPPDFLLETDQKNIVILDVVKGIKKTVVIDDISQIKERKIVSLHDFDLGFFLKLLGAMKIKKNIKIIGIPQSGEINKIVREVKACL